MKKIRFIEKVLEIKEEIFNILIKYMDDNELTQVKAGKALDVSQSEISKFKARRYQHFSLERLFKFLDRIGYNVDIILDKKESESEE